jgi:thioredoxin reductase (NADPH)
MIPPNGAIPPADPEPKQTPETTLAACTQPPEVAAGE